MRLMRLVIWNGMILFIVSEVLVCFMFLIDRMCVLVLKRCCVLWYVICVSRLMDLFRLCVWMILGIFVSLLMMCGSLVCCILMFMNVCSGNLSIFGVKDCL